MIIIIDWVRSILDPFFIICFEEMRADKFYFALQTYFNFSFFYFFFYFGFINVRRLQKIDSTNYIRKKKKKIIKRNIFLFFPNRTDMVKVSIAVPLIVNQRNRGSGRARHSLALRSIEKRIVWIHVFRMYYL